MMRAALYARVSSEEQVEGYSIDAQRRAFQTLVDNRGWTVYREYIEEGKSAHTDDLRKRPVFLEATGDALAGKYDVLVVHKIDRFSRKLKITLPTIAVAIASAIQKPSFRFPMRTVYHRLKKETTKD